MSMNADQCAGSNRHSLFHRLNWRIQNRLWWALHHLFSWVALKTQKYTEPGFNNRFLAGLHEFTWTYFCGSGWAFAWKMGMIYWRPK